MDEETTCDWSIGPEVAINELLFDRLSQAIHINSNKTAVSHRSQTLSYKDLQTQINQVKACLKDAGVKPGDFVGIMMPRALPLLPCLLGTMAGGAAVRSSQAYSTHQTCEQIDRTNRR